MLRQVALIGASMPALTSSDPAALARWEAWDRFLESRPDGGFRQSSWWAAASPSDAGAAVALVVRRGGILLGGGVVQLRPWGPGRAAYVMPDGPVIPPRVRSGSEVLGVLLQALRAHRAPGGPAVSHLRIAPRWTEWPGYLADLATPHPVGDDPVCGPRRLMSVDLRSSETGILARMSPAARANIALARRFGLSVTEDDSVQGVAELQEMSGPGVDESLPDLITSLRRSGRGGVLFVEDGDTRLAGAVWIRHGARATLCHAAAWHAGRQVIGPTLLEFEVMRRAKAAGCGWYERPHSALAEELGGEPIHLVPVADLVFDPAAYETYRARERA